MPDSRNPLVGGLRRVFGLGAIGLAVAVIAMLSLFIVDGRIERSAAVSRDLIEIGRRADFFAIERQSEVRGYVISGRETRHAPDPALARRFAVTVDSLVASSSHDEQRLARAHGIQRAIARWKRAYVRPALSDVLEGRSEAAHAIAGDQLFESVRGAISIFIQAEERNYSSRLAYHATARRLWILGL
ncbi:MAG: CHASE3 domain-containing protein, partial [Gemmatimonadaceae bacterium]